MLTTTTATATATATTTTFLYKFPRCCHFRHTKQVVPSQIALSDSSVTLLLDFVGWYNPTTNQIIQVVRHRRPSGYCMCCSIIHLTLHLVVILNVLTTTTTFLCISFHVVVAIIIARTSKYVVPTTKCKK